MIVRIRGLFCKFNRTIFMILSRCCFSWEVTCRVKPSADRSSYGQPRRPDRGRAQRRDAIRPHVLHGVSLTELARNTGIPLRSLQRWSARYRAAGISGLARGRCSDAGKRRLASDLVAVIEGLALGKPRLSAAAIHRRISAMAAAQAWPLPSYAAVYEITRALDPALITLAHDGPTAYRDRFELIHRHRAERPNTIWQADHTQLDILVLDAGGAPARP